VATQSNALKIVQITDTHIQSQPNGCLGNINVDTSLTAVIDHIKQHHWPADLILATGDLVQDEGAPAYQRFRAFLEPLEIPVYCLPGNHDIPQALAAELATGLVRHQRVVTAGSWQFILLDSSLPDSAGGYLADSELVFLDDALASGREPNTMICLHHQPVPIGSPWMDKMMVDNAGAFWTIVDRYPKVRSVIWGHIHQTFSSRRNDVQLFGTPSTCLQFRPEQTDPQFDDIAPGYRWFEVYDDGTLSTGIERAVAECFS
jgi:Icc protein